MSASVHVLPSQFIIRACCTTHTLYRLLVNAVNEEGSLRRELEEEVEELRELHTLDSRGNALDYQRELANWKIYEKARVYCMNRCN